MQAKAKQKRGESERRRSQRGDLWKTLQKLPLVIKKKEGLGWKIDPWMYSIKKWLKSCPLQYHWLQTRLKFYIFDIQSSVTLTDHVRGLCLSQKVFKYWASPNQEQTKQSLLNPSTTWVSFLSFFTRSPLFKSWRVCYSLVYLSLEAMYLFCLWHIRETL